ncbi:MAG: N-acetyltransferase family protein [Planctomycetaceae bacterium]
MPVAIRAARPEDAHAIAEVHVEGWRWAYRGLVPDTYLDGLDVDARERMWAESLAHPGDAWGCFVADEGGRVVGFVGCGPPDDAEAPTGAGEVYAIYVSQEVQGTGVGRALFVRAEAALAEHRFRTGVLWVLEANHLARRFYERAGWAPDGAVGEHPFGDLEPLPTVRYAGDLATRGTRSGGLVGREP